jgi:hypothetical protein
LQKNLIKFFSIAPKLTASCSVGWIGFGDSCYRFGQDFLTWSQAETRCKEFGADSHLASCKTEKDLFFLAFQQKTNLDAFFLGISDQYVIFYFNAKIEYYTGDAINV